jgi:hypothetical protein
MKYDVADSCDCSQAGLKPSQKKIWKVSRINCTTVMFIALMTIRQRWQLWTFVSTTQVRVSHARVWIEVRITETRM